MKRMLVWLFTTGLSVDVDGVKYVPDWNAIGAVGGAAAAVIGLIAVWLSIRTFRQQLRHQTDLDAKHLEQELLLNVMNLTQAPFDASQAFVAEILTRGYSGKEKHDPEYFLSAVQKVLTEHRGLGTATAAALSVLRRSRPRRFPSGVQDEALNQYDDLVQRTVKANSAMLQYCMQDPEQFDMAAFENGVGSDAFEMSNALRRVTGEMLARMYATDAEWVRIQFAQRSIATSGKKVDVFDFADTERLGR